MKSKDIVKFRQPINEEEVKSLMVVIDIRENRVLVSDLRFSTWNLSPTNVYLMSDLEVVTDSTKTERKFF